MVLKIWTWKLKAEGSKQEAERLKAEGKEVKKKNIRHGLQE